MSTQLGSGLYKIFLVAVLGVSVGGCDVPAAIARFFAGFPACAKAMKSPCTCSTEADYEAIDKNTGDRLCSSPTETTNPRCQIRAMGTPLVIVPTGLVVVTNRGIGLPAACEPFEIRWNYYNAGNTRASPVPGVRLAITEEEPTNVPPAERFRFTRDVPWSSLAPCEREDERVSLPQGINPDPRHTSQAYNAEILLPDGATSLPNAFTRLVLSGSTCP